MSEFFPQRFYDRCEDPRAVIQYIYELINAQSPRNAQDSRAEREDDFVLVVFHYRFSLCLFKPRKSTRDFI